MQREIVLDTETTGLDYHGGHRVIEIGCVELIDGQRTGNTYHEYINPEREIDASAEKIHGLSTEFLKDKPSFKELAQGFVDYIGDSKIVAHNAKFDVGFLNHHLEQLKMPLIKQENVVDTLPMARRKFPGQKNSLDALCVRFKVDNSNRTFHGALLDAELLADVYAELTGVGSTQRNIRFNEEEGEDNTASNPAILSKNGQNYPKRQFKTSEDEAKAHKSMLAKIKDALWEKIDN